jgi:hypothetical protein
MFVIGNHMGLASDIHSEVVMIMLLGSIGD